MNHIFFFLFLLIFASGISSLIVVGLLYWKFKNRLLIYYFFLLLGLALISFIELLDYFYSDIFPFDIYDPLLIFEHIFSIVYFLIYTVIIYFLTIITYCLVARPNQIIKKCIYTFIVFFYPLLVFILNFINIHLLRQLADIILYGCMIYNIILLNKNLCKIKIPLLRKFIKLLLVLNMIFTPVFILQTFFIYLPVTLPAWFYEIPHIFMLYYVFWNCFNIYFAAKVFFRPIFPTNNSIPIQFIKSYLITDREREIISLLIKGESNKEIAFHLSIAENTVKNHIYNIFKKTKTNNRIELMNQVQSFLLNNF